MAPVTSAGATSSPTQAQKATVGIYTMDDLRALAGARPPFRVAGLLVERSSNLIVGDSGLGKTALLIQLGLAIASGHPFLGHPVVRGPVLLCDGESNIHELIDMVERIATYLGLGQIPDEFEIWSPNFDQSPSGKPVASQLEDRVRLANPDVVLVDPMRVFWPEAEQKTNFAVAMYATHRSVTKDVGCLWVTVHHPRKEDRQNPVSLEKDRHRWLQEAAGVRALINQADTRLGVDSTAKQGADLVLAGFVRGVGWLESEYLVRVLDDVGDPVGYDLVQGVGLLNPQFQQAYNGLPDPFRFKDAKQALGGNSDSNTVSFLKQCMAAGLVKKVGGGYQKCVPQP